MDYDAAVDLLNRRGNEVQEIHLGLHRIDAVLRSLRNPQNAFPCIHIAGTNGKGSVAAMCDSILRHAGLATGLYSSPHLISFRERIRVNGRCIPEGAFAETAAQVLGTEDQLIRSGEIERPLTYFEMVTACAFEYFARRRVDCAVIEVGLGGRLDATNVMWPRVAVITSIARDHAELLGSSIGQIAAEKAGIIKGTIPVISGVGAGVAQKVIRNAARRAEAPLFEFGREIEARITGGADGYPVFNLKTPRGEYSRLKSGLAGAHQVVNAALAVAAAEHMPTKLKGGVVRRALAATRWPGRIDEYPASPRTLLDGAHNPAAAQQLAAFLRPRYKGAHIVFGVLRDKDFRTMGRALFPLAERIYLAPVPNSRSADPVLVLKAFPQYRRRTTVHPTAEHALDEAWRRCPPEGTVVVTGSLYLIGQLFTKVRRRARRSLRRRAHAGVT